jgi:hypothetical protein
MLTCRGRVKEPVRMEPSRLGFGQVSRTAGSQSKTVVVTRGDGGPLALKLLPTEAQGVRTELREIEPGERYEIQITVTPPFKSTEVSKSVQLETGVPEAPTVTVPIHAVMRPRVISDPRRFSFPAKRDGPWQQGVSLVWDDDAPHRILEATVEDPEMTVKVTEVDGKQRVVLQVPPNHIPPRSARSVTVKTDDAEAPLVRIPIIVPRDTKVGG